MRASAVLAVACLLALVAGTVARPLEVASGGAVGDAPWFCHDLECPKYKLVENLTDIGIEHRTYPSGTRAGPPSGRVLKTCGPSPASTLGLLRIELVLAHSHTSSLLSSLKPSRSAPFILLSSLDTSSQVGDHHRRRQELRRQRGHGLLAAVQVHQR
jgi:hypothetical protein